MHSTLVNAPAAMKQGIGHKVSALVAGAAPPASMIEGVEQLGFDLTHVYGLTEVYGPAAVCAKQPEWMDADIGERARLMGRQGVAYTLQEGITVMDPETMREVPRDGETMGEIMFRGNIVMKGYLKNPGDEEAFAGGWFHTGDLGVLHPDGYVKIKDRSKDIIISGGENISSLEVEDVIYRHPAVLACAVVAAPDPKWGETPCAFVELKAGATVSARRADRPLPRPPRELQDAAPGGVWGAAQDFDRQDPEVRAARAREVDRCHRMTPRSPLRAPLRGRGAGRG